MRRADPIPRFDPSCNPSLIIGTAALTTAAVHGAGPDALAGMIERMDDDPIARLYDTSVAYQLAFRRAEGLGLQDDALARSPLFRVRREGGGATRLLALAAPGDLMVNTPLDFITNHLDVRLDLLFLTPGQALPAAVPDHDLMFVAVSDADPALLSRLNRLVRSWPRPVLNDPALLPVLARDRLADRLSALPGICIAPTVEIGRAGLEDFCRGPGRIGDILSGCTYPVLLRPAGSHAGHGLKKIDGPDDLASYLLFSFATSYFLTAFVDYRSADGLYRKYRVAFIDRQPHLCHLAISQNWMVHYLNAGMAESADKRAEEALAMAEFHRAFAHRHRAAFDALHDRLGFDYYSIDCGELPDGRLLVFEADTAAIIHAMDASETFPYKYPHMQGVFDAFGAMLRRHAAAGRREYGPRADDAASRVC